MSEYGNFVGITFENVGKTIGKLWGIEMVLGERLYFLAYKFLQVVYAT